MIKAILAAVAGTVVLLAVAFWLGAQSGDAPTPQAAPTPSQTRTSSTPPAIPGSPEIGARRWLQAQQSLHWRDERPDAWIERTAPWSTSTLQDELGQYRGGSGGAVWVEFVRRRCERTVTDLTAAVSPEAPTSAQQRWVVASATAITTCDAGDGGPPLPAREAVQVMLEMRHQPDGAWLAHRRVEAG